PSTPPRPIPSFPTRRSSDLAQIRADMNTTLAGSEEGLAGYWRFDEAPGSLVTDLSPNQNDGALFGATRVRGPVHLTVSDPDGDRSEEHTSELQSRGHLVCRL